MHGYWDNHTIFRASEIILKDMDRTSSTQNVSLRSAYHFFTIQDMYFEYHQLSYTSILQRLVT